VPQPDREEEDAVDTFVQKHADKITGTLGCFDRVLFKGHLPFGDDAYLNRFVDHVLHLRRKDFYDSLGPQSDALVEHAQRQAEQQGAPYRYLQGVHDKAKLIDQILRERQVTEGLVAVLACQENCRTVKLLYGQGRPRLRFAHRPQRVLYFYFLDPDFGLLYVRLQTWFPFTTQVYVNGHEWLARQLLQARAGFVQRDNCFTQLDDPATAQRLADRFPKLPWVSLLRRWAGQVNPLLKQGWLRGQSYRWVLDQAEYSTDVLFRKPQDLGGLYGRLLEHATAHFTPQDVMTFLGRRLHPRFEGEVQTRYQERGRGARVKHYVKRNWLKMYDKFGQVLRIETVINQPREFKVRRLRTRHGRRRMAWCPMNKGVANFYHYHHVSRAANHRYLEALAVVEAPRAAEKQLDRASQPRRYHGRRRRGLNLLRVGEQRLFRAVLRGHHRLQGFRNRDVAHDLFGAAPRDQAGRRRRTARVSRLLGLLRAHGLIAKVPHSHRYRVTAKGDALMNAALYARYKIFPKELQDVG
jgi:hypothetical protein